MKGMGYWAMKRAISGGKVWSNQPWVGKQLKTNSRIAVSGRVTEFGYRKVFENPEWELIEDKELMHTGRLVPVYQLTQQSHP